MTFLLKARCIPFVTLPIREPSLQDSITFSPSLNGVLSVLARELNRKFSETNFLCFPSSIWCGSRECGKSRSHYIDVKAQNWPKISLLITDPFVAPFYFIDSLNNIMNMYEFTTELENKNITFQDFNLSQPYISS